MSSSVRRGQKFSRDNLTLSIPQKINTGESPRKEGGRRGSRKSWQEPPPPQQRTLATNFGLLLRRQTPPVPPALLRTLPGATQPSTARQKDASEKLKVLVRVTAKGEKSRSPNASCLSIDGRRKQLTLVDPSPNAQVTAASRSKQSVPKLFGFDNIFAQDDSLTEICSATLLDVVHTVISGSDSCLLAFGHSSPGKSQTLFGSDQSVQDMGLFPSAISWLFRAVQESRERNPDSRFSVRVSAVEVCGPSEELRDLLADQDGCSSQTNGDLVIKDDPVMGTQLQNLSELRAQTPDVAAYFLDCALASRRSKNAEEQRNSHLFFTLHVYQYKMESGRSGVAGGRTRLHLIDLGSGEKSSKPGRSSLTLPALGNVLLTLLQGQKYLPFKESKLTLMLKEAVASTACRAVTAVACVSAEEDYYFDTLNIVQIASRLHRIRRQRKTRMGLGSQNSSGGESSCDDRRRRRLPRSASDPDCTTSSSEQSCDTVIYLGDPKGPRYPHSRRESDREATTDDNSPPSTIRARPEPLTPTAAGSLSLPGSPRNASSPLNIFRASPLLGGRKSEHPQETWIDGPKAQPSPVHHQPLKQPRLQHHELHRTEGEKWIDGPKAGEKKPEDGLILDPFKREMIQKWVHYQEEQRMAVAEYWADGSVDPKEEDTSPPALPQPRTHYTSESDQEGTGSAETKESPVEMREICIQCDEADIDFELGQLDAQYRWRAHEMEIRFLEDIQEETEDSLSSDTHSLKSGRSSRSTSARDFAIRNEGLANPMSVPSILLDPLTLGGLEMLGISNPTLPSDPSYSADRISEEHPLRILSREGGMERERSDSFSINSEHLDSLSLPATDQLDDDEEILSDEDLEKAMAASLTSVRSHEILEQLRSEARWEELRQQARESSERQRKEVEAQYFPASSTLPRESKRPYQSPKRKPEPPKFEIQSIKRVPPLSTFQSPHEDAETDEVLIMEMEEESNVVNYRRSFQLPPDGSEEIYSAYPEPPPPPHKPNAHKIPLVCCSMTTSSGSSNQSWSKFKSGKATRTESPLVKCDKMQRPTVPALPAAVSREITSKIASAVAKRSVSESPRHSGSKLRSLEVTKARSPSAESAKPVTEPIRSRLPSPMTLSATSGAPKPGWGRRDSGLSASQTKGRKEPLGGSAGKPAGKKASKGQSTEKKSASSGTSTSPKAASALMNFLRSPTRASMKKTFGAANAIPAPVSASNRASSGYDSGHDSGIVGGSSSASPELQILSPYRKVTRPRASQRSSSGHGSDGSSVQSGDLTAGPSKPPTPSVPTTESRLATPKKTAHGGFHSRLSSFLKGKSKARESVVTSSGYESVRGDSSDTSAEGKATVVCAESPSSVKSPPSARITRKNYFGSIPVTSRSAPQSPCGMQKMGKLDEKAEARRQEEMRSIRKLQRQVTSIKAKQDVLKEDLRSAKERLGIADEKWSFELHAEDCLELGDPGLIEALEQETRILEKRVVACRSHVLMVTSFDAAPDKT